MIVIKFWLEVQQYIIDEFLSFEHSKIAILPEVKFS
jgi:hypothetical protein